MRIYTRAIIPPFKEPDLHATGSGQRLQAMVSAVWIQMVRTIGPGDRNDGRAAMDARLRTGLPFSLWRELLSLHRTAEAIETQLHCVHVSHPTWAIRGSREKP